MFIDSIMGLIDLGTLQSSLDNICAICDIIMMAAGVGRAAIVDTTEFLSFLETLFSENDRSVFCLFCF